MLRTGLDSLDMSLQRDIDILRKVNVSLKVEILVSLTLLSLVIAGFFFFYPLSALEPHAA